MLKTEERNTEIFPEVNGIGLKNESSLHNSIKKWYLHPEDRLECRVDGFVVDIMRDELLIEIQTRNIGAISKKLKKLAKNHKIKLVHPIAVEKWITKLSYPEEEVLSRKRSPKKGQLTDIFDELVKAADLISEENITIEILFIKVEEFRIMDGMGSWRRKGWSIKDRALLEVTDIVEFDDKHEFMKFIPEQLEQPFTNKDLAAALKIKAPKAARITYTLKKNGLICETGKKGNSILYAVEK